MCKSPTLAVGLLHVSRPHGAGQAAQHAVDTEVAMTSHIVPLLMITGLLLGACNERPGVPPPPKTADVPTATATQTPAATSGTSPAVTGTPPATSGTPPAANAAAITYAASPEEGINFSKPGLPEFVAK